MLRIENIGANMIGTIKMIVEKSKKMRAAFFFTKDEFNIMPLLAFLPDRLRELGVGKFLDVELGHSIFSRIAQFR